MNLTGNAGNDTLQGSVFADTLTGGAGNDTFRIIGFIPPGGYASVSAAETITITDFAAGDKIDLSFLPITSLTDLSLFSTVVAGSLELQFWVNDYLQTVQLQGIAALTAGDVILSNSLTGLSVSAGSGRNDLLGANGADNLNGDIGDYRAAAAGGNDTINVYGGADTVYGGGGSDVIDAGADDDSIRGDLGNDSISGSDGADFIQGGENNDTLWGESENNDDAVWNDTLDGGLGNDFLSGGAGTDLLTGGGGIDTFRVYGRQYSGEQLTSDTRDTVTDFGSDDKIDVSNLGISDIATLRYLTAANGATGMIATLWNNGWRRQ